MRSFEFGSKEWVEEVKRRVKFPQMFVVFYGLHRETNEPILHTVKLDTKSKDPKNIRFGSVSEPTLKMVLSKYNWLIEGVYYIESVDEYLEKMKELGKKWNIPEMIN